VTTRHDQHSIRRKQRLEPQTVRQRLPGPNREVQLARELRLDPSLQRNELDPVQHLSRLYRLA
jgi:hypothetical protein